MQEDDDDDDDDDGYGDYGNGYDDDDCDYDDNDEVCIQSYALLSTSLFTCLLNSSRGLNISFPCSRLPLGCRPLMFPVDSNERPAMGSSHSVSVILIASEIWQRCQRLGANRAIGIAQIPLHPMWITHV